VPLQHLKLRDVGTVLVTALARDSPAVLAAGGGPILSTADVLPVCWFNPTSNIHDILDKN